MALETLLKNRFGYRGFRPGQRDICTQVTAGRDALVVMPTGSGKSLCYQLPALARGGTTLVVSPLIALMKDQVDTLNGHGIRATYINSSIPPRERAQRIHEMQAGEWELVYVAPERFQPDFLNRLQQCDIRLLAIDEAHCLSSWGHDFRPDYLRLGQVRETLGSLPTVALTATATPRVQNDIVEHLRLEGAERFILGFDRENLTLEVHECRGTKAKARASAHAVQHKRAIVYAATRRNVERAAQALQSAGIHAGFYHAGMELEERNHVQDAFMSGDLPVVVATNAFGMGVDKPDIRVVVHWDIPGTVEAYYQEIGRAGRDGQPARIVLLYGPGDRKTQEFFIQMSHPPVDLIHQVYQHINELGENPVFRPRSEIAAGVDHKDANERSISSCLTLLEREGWLSRLPPGSGPGRSGGVLLTHPGRSLVFDESDLQTRRELEYSKLEHMVDYTRS
ncbi:MAG: ATP-dependent DNA helicase RecQ, partial [Myxococcota bacterium]|nr:ATP-dependent DNA helicase RecQ [Myxococcota bacterium]